MQITRALSRLLAVPLILSGCAQFPPPARPLPAPPFAYLSLTACRDYRSNIVECQLEYGTKFGRHRLGPVQEVALALATDRDDGRYQVSSCWPAPRVQRELPNFVCRIYGARSGNDTGSVLIKGGTAVRLARILRDREQFEYRWTPDPWSRLRD